MIYRASKRLKLSVIVIAVFTALILPCCVEAITYPISKTELSVVSVNLYESSDGTGNFIKSFHNIKAFSVKAQISNFSDNDKEVTLYAALYNKSGEVTELAKILSVNESVLRGTTKDLILPFSDDSISTDSNLKIFVWETKNLVPLTDVIEYSGKLTEVYVSADDGDDSGTGTLNHPFKTIERAQREVREFNSSMDEDIIVYLREGVYTLSDTLNFSEEDSGRNECCVKYKAYNNEDVTVSGGIKINGFSDPDGDGIYTAAVEDDDITSIRELYVNGRKAVRAMSEKKIEPVSIYEVNGKKLGYYVKSSEIGTFANPDDMQFHYSRGWASVTVNVKSLVDAGNGLTLVLMDEIPFELMTTFEPYAGSTSPTDGKTYHIFWLTEQNKFYAENALELLDNGGEFYFDKKTKILHYKPLADENAENLEVYAPKLETLIKIKGKDLADKAENIVFEGITFAHATAERFDNGFLGDQAQTQLVFNAPKSAYAPDNIIVGANIVVSAADSIVFRNNVFKGLGKVGVGLYEGAENVLIDKNAFCDIGDSAVTIGTPQDAYMEDLSNGKNVAYNKNVTSTVNEIGNFAAYANDGDKLRGWNIYDERTYKPGVTNYMDEYWQVDLDKPYKIDKIILKQREIETERTNFEVLGSNSSDFSNYTVLYNIGDENDEKYTTSGDITATVADNTKYRYVRVRKTTNSYFYMPEIEIISFDENVPSKEVCKNNTVSNNYITRIGEYNWGAPGIQAYYTDSTEISSNYIYDIPYSGICFGWGWINTPDSVTSRNMVVKNNRIEKYAQRSYDAGGIYTLGQEPGSMIYGNYIKDQVNAYAAYYPDSGSGNSYVYNNVFENTDIAYHIHSATQHDLRIENNYSTNGFYYDRGTDCSVSAPAVFTVANVPEEAQNIINSAGLTGENALIVSKVPTRHKELSFDDIYGNAIEEDNPNILSMPTMEVLIPTYLSRKISEAENVIDITEGASSDSVNLLQKVIDEAKAVEQLGRTADRTEVIRQRVKLIEAIKTFCDVNKKID